MMLRFVFIRMFVSIVFGMNWIMFDSFSSIVSRNRLWMMFEEW